MMESKKNKKQLDKKNPKLTILIRHGVKVCTPDNYKLLTPYVLLEQEDWFEDEIKFLRRWLQPGMNVVDVGANFGVYALSAAKQVGPDGQVWAFEPTSTTASYLQQSIDSNQFKNLHLIPAGLSDKSGTAKLVLHDNSEMNEISLNESSGGETETIKIHTLDECMDEMKWPEIDFIKIDAENHEQQVINGGQHFFVKQSPLVMYEIKAGEKINLSLVKKFEGIGYESYRLLPELDCLVPYCEGDKLDEFQLNLFCCKPECARKLADQGKLIAKDGAEMHDPRPIRRWKEYCHRFPYGRALSSDWMKYIESDKTAPLLGEYLHVLDLTAEAMSTENIAICYENLKKAYEMLLAILEKNATFPRLMSFARIAHLLGQRSATVKVLRDLGNLGAQNQVSLQEPFLAVSDQYESVNIDHGLADWVNRSILEQFVRLHTFSSYYTGDVDLGFLETLKDLGNSSPELERRRQLVRVLCDMQKNPECNALLKKESEDSLNVTFWC